MTKPERIIVHIIATNFYGGPEKQIIEHLKRLNRNKKYRGVLISYLESDQKNEILEIAEKEGIPNYGIPMSGPFDFRALKNLTKITQDIDANLICAHHYKAVVMGWLVARRLGIPILNYSRGYTEESLKIKFYEWLERRVVDKMAGVISVSFGQKLKLQKLGIKKIPFWVVHNGVEVKAFKRSQSKVFKNQLTKELKIEGDYLLAASVGRLSPEKGHRFLLEAIQNLDPKYSNIYFLICGDGVLKEALISMADKSGIMDKLRFIGFRSDMDKIYQIIDFLVLPSLTEGLPNVVLEAFSYSKPVVATNVGGVPEIVEDRINGIIVKPASPDEIKTAIEFISEDASRRETFGNAGLEKVKNKFTFDAQTNELVTIYDHFLMQT